MNNLLKKHQDLVLMSQSDLNVGLIQEREREMSQ